MLERSEGLANEPNTTYNKYKESANMFLVVYSDSQPGLDIPSIVLQLARQKSQTTTLFSVDYV
jgi:hypothetical protein